MECRSVIAGSPPLPFARPPVIVYARLACPVLRRPVTPCLYLLPAILSPTPPHLALPRSSASLAAAPCPCYPADPLPPAYACCPPSYAPLYHLWLRLAHWPNPAIASLPTRCRFPPHARSAIAIPPPRMQAHDCIRPCLFDIRLISYRGA